ncbi:MAG: asparaginase [Candidatus Eisenbacteria bacterium]|nr:asparaginase [Candidatus Eisenbacteria bacterium]
MDPRVLEVTRGALVESRHVVHAAASDGARLIATFGDPHRVTYYRSASKVFQAFPLVESGAADHFGLGPRELAIACGSHSGTALHVATVLDMLSRAGLGVEHLQCGTHAPTDAAAARELADSGRKPTAACHNCSGKHAGMLLATRFRGWPVETYLDPEHPHQVEIRRIVADYAGMGPGDVAVAVDGCSAPVFAVPLLSMAHSYARFIRGLGPDGAPSATVARLLDAVRAEPDMVGGPGKLDTEFMRASGGGYIVKIGAEAVYCVGHVPTGRGLAFKVEDGNMRAVPAALFDLLGALGWPIPAGLERFARPEVRNFRDRVVGEIRGAGGA